MGTLPEEMICSILGYLSFTDLMKCRQVSRRFKLAASTVARRQHVHLRSEWGPPNFEEMMCTFKDLGDQLPWSACTINVTNSKRKLDDSGDALTPDMFRRFLDAFGTQIRKVTLTGNRTAFIIDVFNGMPNLETLIIGAETNEMLLPEPETWDHIVDAENNVSVKLRKLQDLHVLELSLYTFARITRFLFNRINVQHLRYFHFTIGHTFNFTQLNSLLEGLTSIPSISIQYVDASSNDLDMFEHLANSGLKVTEFRLDYLPMSSVLNDSPHFFRPLEHFLKQNSNRLTYLRIGDNRLTARHAQDCKLTLPPLPRLKTLELDTYGPRNEHPYQPLLSSLTPFQPNQFKKLEKLIVVMKNGHVAESLFSALSIHADSVKELRIYEHGPAEYHSSVKANWNQVLPNVRKVEVSGVSKATLKHVLEMEKLEHLDISAPYTEPHTIGNMFNCKIDSSIIYSAYPSNEKTETANAACLGLNVEQENSDTGPEFKEDQHTFLSLINLKTLAINFRYCDLRCRTDSSVHLKLLQLPPLDCLTLDGVKVSDECREKLSGHHKKFLHEDTLKGREAVIVFSHLGGLNIPTIFRERKWAFLEHY